MPTTATNTLASSVIGGAHDDIATAIMDHPELRTWRNPLGQTLLDFFVFCNDAEAIQAVLRVAPEQAVMTDSLGQTPAHVAAREGNVPVLSQLVTACPACATIPDPNGHTPEDLIALAVDAEASAGHLNGLRSWVSRILSSDPGWKRQ